MTLPKTAKGVAYIEVQTKEDEQIIETDSEVEIHWIHNPTPGKTTRMPDAVRSASLPQNGSIKRFAYIAAEFSVVKNIREFLRRESGWSAGELNAYGYWKLGAIEEKSAHERHDESHEEQL